MTKPSRATGIKKLSQPQMKQFFGTENQKLEVRKLNRIDKDNQKANIQSKVLQTEYLNSPEDSKTTPWVNSSKK